MLISRDILRKRLEEERMLFKQTHPNSYRLFERSRKSLLAGVPMNWMVRWAGDFPVFVKEGKGAHFQDIDGNDYVDLCLGDTGAMTGHTSPEIAAAIQQQVTRGLTFMLPTEDAAWVGEELSRRFGLPYWQIALTATDANRFAIRLARQITKRHKILVFNWCYHGTVDETLITLHADGATRPRAGNLGPPVDPSITTKVVEFNDVEALQKALFPGDVACVLAEPVMTNIGIVHPEDGYHDALREITRRMGTLLILDETHTICAGPGGYTREHDLKPDLFVIGKPIAGGIPAAAYGMSAEVANRVQEAMDLDTADTGGIGGTLSGNALSLAAIRVTLQKILTEEAYAHTIPLAEKFTEHVQKAIQVFQLPWTVQRLGCRAEYWFSENAPRNGSEAAATIDSELDRYMHLAALNRGILMTPFHNMALIAPQTTSADIDHHTRVFRESVSNLLG
jgi:glutamate-1-semialdehyde 2,1-aminomutase